MDNTKKNDSGEESKWSFPEFEMESRLEESHFEDFTSAGQSPANNNATLVSEWQFPEVEVLAESSQKEDLLSDNQNHYLEESKEDINIVSTSQKEIKEEINTEMENLKIEVEQLKSEYETKITLLNHIFQQLTHPLSVIDNEMIDLIIVIIKNITKKIIYKEIDADPNLIKKMIEELGKEIQSQNGLINVCLSQADYEKLANNDSQLTLAVKPDLNIGDIIIKSNFTEIRAVLTERIDQLMRSYD